MGGSGIAATATPLARETRGVEPVRHAGVNVTVCWCPLLFVELFVTA